MKTMDDVIEEILVDAIEQRTIELQGEGRLIHTGYNDSLDFAEAALKALQEAGYRVVPYEPTHNMCEAGHVADPTFRCDDAEDVPRAYYQAMIDAA